jgi:acetolactate synthase-1/2/3 large subunit
MAALREADLLVVLGARLSDITTQGYSFPRLVRPQMTLVHIHADPAVIGTHFAADLAIACDPQALIAAIGAPAVPTPPARQGWVARLAALRRTIATPRHFTASDGIAFESVVETVGRHLARDAIVTLDAGTFGAPVYRIVPFVPPQRLLAPISGAMGFGVPAAVAAGLRVPGRQIVCFVGDGGFLMTGNELAVALERRLPLKVILSENGIYASIWIHQEREYPGRIVGTTFANPDFALIGQAFGFTVTRLARPQDLEALPGLLSRPGPDFIIVATSVEAIRPQPRSLSTAPAVGRLQAAPLS